MKTVAFVPIKLNNERTPGKNTKEFFDGTPLIHFIEKTLLKVSNIDEVYVYCSSEAITPYLLDGVKFLKRPEFLDGPSCNATQLVENFTKTIDADVYVMAHATSPFVKSETIYDCVDKVINDDYDSAYPVKRMQNFFWYEGKPLNFELDNIKRTQDVEPLFCELCTPFVFKKEVFLKYRARTGVKPYQKEEDEIESIDIDYPEDFELANAIYRSRMNREM